MTTPARSGGRFATAILAPLEQGSRLPFSPSLCWQGNGPQESTAHMPSRPWLPLNPGDYLRDTTDLSLEEHGSYLLLIMHAWVNDGVIPDDPRRIGRILGVHTNKAKTLWGKVGGYWYETQGGFRHKRIDKELAKYLDISEKRSAAAHKRHHAKGPAIAPASAYTNQRSDLSSLRSESRSRSNGTDSEVLESFAAWYALYPKKQAKQDGLKAWKALKPAEREAAMAALPGWPFKPEREYQPLPASWLRGKRWEDETAGPAPDEPRGWK